MQRGFEDLNIAEFKNYIQNKEVAVVGIGVSNMPLIRFLCTCGAKVTAFDKKENDKLRALQKEGIPTYAGEDYLAHITQDIVYKSPGIRPDAAELLSIQKRGGIITSEMETFFALCPAKIIGVTGSDGKTTTTTLIYTMLKAAGYTCHLGGNIGRPLIEDIEKISAEDTVVVELSSFQLFTMKKSPAISVITNLSPNHLDYHLSMEEYVDAKKNIFLHQGPMERLILNADNALTCSLANLSNGEVVMFSKEPMEKGVSLHNGYICANEKKIVNIKDIKIPGMHNVENMMAAIAAVMDMVPAQIMEEVAKTFGGVPHRIELVREINGVKYYNSSIDSSPNRTKNTLAVFKQKVILIAGGKDKGISYDEIGPIIRDKVKTLILIGDTAKQIEQAVQSAGGMAEIIHCKTYDEVVSCAQRIAKSGDIVVLSPASTSFDMFKNFEERGDLFKELVGRL